MMPSSNQFIIYFFEITRFDFNFFFQFLFFQFILLFYFILFIYFSNVTYHPCII